MQDTEIYYVSHEPLHTVLIYSQSTEASFSEKAPTCPMLTKMTFTSFTMSLFSSTNFVVVGVCHLFMARIWVECGVLITNLRNFCCWTFWPRLCSFKSGSDLVTLSSPTGSTLGIHISGHF